MRDLSSINQAPVAAHVTANAADIRDSGRATHLGASRPPGWLDGYRADAKRLS